MQEKAGRDVFKAFVGCFMVAMLGVALLLAFCANVRAQSIELVTAADRARWDTRALELYRQMNQGKEGAVYRVRNLPLVTTITSGLWDTGVTLVNTTISGESIVLSRCEYIDKTQDSLNLGFGQNVVLAPGRRWSALLSQIIGLERDGQVNLFVISSLDAKFSTIGMTFQDGHPVVEMTVQDLTTREMR